MRAFVGAAALTTISTALTLLVGVGRTKLVAVVLGAYGVGVLGQVNAALQFAASIVAVGFGNALVRRTAAPDAEHDSASSLLTTSYLVILGLAAPLVAFLVLAPTDATASIFGKDSPPLAPLALAVAIPLVALANIETAVVRGLKDVRMLTIATSTSGVLGLALLGPLVFFFGVNGALVHVALFGALGYAVSYLARHAAASHARFGVSLMALPTRRALGMLLSYGSANAIASVLNTATLLLVRAYIIDTLGLEANGMYQVLLGIPAQTLVIVFNTLSAYAFPLVSGLRERADIHHALNLSLRFTLLSTTPLILLLVLLSAPLIRVLYSSEFLPAAQILPVQLVGDYFKTLAWALGLSLLGRGHLLAFTLLDTAWNMVFATGAFLLTPRLGLAGTAASYAAAYIVHALATYVFQHKREGVRLTPANVRLLLASSVLLGGGVAVVFGTESNVRLAYAALGIVAWAWFGTRRSEWLAAWRAGTRWVRPVTSSTR